MMEVISYLLMGVGAVVMASGFFFMVKEARNGGPTGVESFPSLEDGLLLTGSSLLGLGLVLPSVLDLVFP